jgi:hypothetical protein
MATVTRQRGDSDCAIAALATLAPALSYHRIATAGKRVSPTQGRDGFYNREVLALAAAVGIMLRPVRRYNLDRDAGLLRIEATERRGARAKAVQHAHFVCVRDGLILEVADGSATPWREYLAARGVTFRTLLRLT